MNSKQLLAACGICLLSSTAFAAGPTVSGNVISWTESGWHQVQKQSTYESVCEGGQQCTVPNGVYTVINHGTGERFMDVPVKGKLTNEVPAPVLVTGQTQSYGQGDDGDYQLGLAPAGARFIDNADGTFTDSLTGLVWLSVGECIVKRDWSSALDHANNLSAGGENCISLNDGSTAGDWRLPNVKELYSLVDIADNSPAWAEGIPLQLGQFEQIPYDPYWSSSSFTASSDTIAFIVNFAFGSVTPNRKTDIEWVWAVR